MIRPCSAIALFSVISALFFPLMIVDIFDAAVPAGDFTGRRKAGRPSGPHPSPFAVKIQYSVLDIDGLAGLQGMLHTLNRRLEIVGVHCLEPVEIAGPIFPQGYGLNPSGADL